MLDHCELEFDTSAVNSIKTDVKTQLYLPVAPFKTVLTLLFYYFFCICFLLFPECAAH